MSEYAKAFEDDRLHDVRLLPMLKPEHWERLVPPLGDRLRIRATLERLQAGGGNEASHSNVCVVCLSSESSQLLLPCRHLCLCPTCILKFNVGDRCPKCQTEIVNKVHVYF